MATPAVTPVLDLPIDGIKDYYRLHGKLLGAYFEACEIDGFEDQNRSVELAIERIKVRFQDLTREFSTFYKGYKDNEQVIQLLTLQMDATENAIRYVSADLVSSFYGIAAVEKEFSSYINGDLWRDEPAYWDLKLGLSLNGLGDFALNPAEGNHSIDATYVYSLPAYGSRNLFFSCLRWRREMKKKLPEEADLVGSIFKQYTSLFSLVKKERNNIEEILDRARVVEQGRYSSHYRYPSSVQPKIVECLERLTEERFEASLEIAKLWEAI
jgi:hypothetical protein